MNRQSDTNLETLAVLAAAGGRDALEQLLGEIQDTVFNLSLRMLGLIPDAEDAAQEILIKVMTHLPDFRGESQFSTWVISIALNHLRSYKKHMFYQRPLSFEYYGDDIAGGREMDVPDRTGGVDQAILEEELKLSCTNVMLQCLDKDSRCVFILGTMFKLDSRLAGEILGMSAESYRKKLSRVREKMAAFLDEYCGLSGKGKCSCKRRINYAIESRRISPEHLEYNRLKPGDSQMLAQFKNAMEKIDDASIVFSDLPFYRCSPELKQFITDFLKSEDYRIVADY